MQINHKTVAWFSQLPHEYSSRLTPPKQAIKQKKKKRFIRLAYVYQNQPWTTADEEMLPNATESVQFPIPTYLEFQSRAPK